MVRKVGPCSKVSFKSPLGRALGPKEQLERSSLPPGITGVLPPSRLERQECAGSAFSRATAAFPGSSPDRPFFNGQINWFCLSDWESSSH